MGGGRTVEGARGAYLRSGLKLNTAMGGWHHVQGVGYQHILVRIAVPQILCADIHKSTRITTAFWHNRH